MTALVKLNQTPQAIRAFMQYRIMASELAKRGIFILMPPLVYPYGWDK